MTIVKEPQENLEEMCIRGKEECVCIDMIHIVGRKRKSEFLLPKTYNRLDPG